MLHYFILHFKEYSHPHLECLKSLPDDAPSTVKNQWQMLKDLNLLKYPEETSKNESNIVKQKQESIDTQKQEYIEKQKQKYLEKQKAVLPKHKPEQPEVYKS